MSLPQSFSTIHWDRRETRLQNKGLPRKQNSCSKLWKTAKLNEIETENDWDKSSVAAVSQSKLGFFVCVFF